MDRRTFLITTGGAAVAAAAQPSASQAGGASEGAAASGQGKLLRLAMRWPDTPQGAADNARRLAQRFVDMTGGRYRIEITAGDDISDHEADLVHGSAHDMAPLHPAFHYFAGLPGFSGLTAQDLGHWIAVGGGQMLWDDLAQPHGWKPLLAGHSGETPPLWSVKPVTRLGDLAGQRISAVGLGADVVRALGAEAVDLGPSQVAAAVGDGSLFAAETDGLLYGMASRMSRAARHATGTGLNGHGTAYALRVRLAVWEGLSEADRAILAAAAATEYQTALAETRAHAQIAQRVVQASFGVTVSPWPLDVAEALDRVSEATVAHVAGRDALAARIDQSYMAFRAAVQGAAAPRRTSSRPVA